MKWREYFADLENQFTNSADQHILRKQKILIDQLLAKPEGANNGLQQEMDDLSDLDILYQLMRDLDLLIAPNNKYEFSLQMIYLCEKYQSIQQRLHQAQFEKTKKDQNVECPPPVKIFTSLAAFYCRKGDQELKENPREALDHYTKAIELHPDPYFFYRKRAQCHMDLNDSASALKDWESAAQLGAPWCYAHRIEVFIAEKNYDAAIADYDKWIKADSRWSPHAEQAILYARKGYFIQAMKSYASFQKALSGSNEPVSIGDLLDTETAPVLTIAE